MRKYYGFVEVLSERGNISEIKCACGKTAFKLTALLLNSPLVTCGCNYALDLTDREIMTHNHWLYIMQDPSQVISTWHIYENFEGEMGYVPSMNNNWKLARIDENLMHNSLNTYWNKVNYARL